MSHVKATTPVVGVTVYTEDTGTNTNPEKWMHEHHWQTPQELVFITGGDAGRQCTGVVVPAGQARRIREITARNAAIVNTVVTLLYDVTVKLSFDVPAQSSRTWESRDGRRIPAGSSSCFEVSDTTGGTVYVSASGIQDNV